MLNKRMKTMKMTTYFAAALVSAVFTLTATAADRPNIVFILADDLGYGDVGCYAPTSERSTPHIDSLAKGGIRFTDAHAQTVCTPTRYGILTGRHHWRTWMTSRVLYPFEVPLIAKDQLTLPGLLQTQGYHTACIGKWHLGMRWQGVDGKPLLAVKENGEPDYRRSRGLLLTKSHLIDYSASIEEGPTTRGFDYYFGESIINQPPFAWIENDRFEKTPAMYWSDDKNVVKPLVWNETEKGNIADPNRWDWKKGGRPNGHASIPEWSPWDVLPEQSRRAQAYIREHAKEDRPFFLYLPLTAVHFPIVPSKEFQGKTDTAYGDFIYQLDSVVGQVVKAVEDSGQLENTLIVFMSDNGAALRYGGNNANAPWRGSKADIYEGAHRVPTIVSWAGTLPTNKVCPLLFSNTDYFRTIASLLDLSLPDDAAPDSFDFSDALRNPTEAPPVRPAAVHCSGQVVFAVRKGDWKLLIPSGRNASVDPDLAKCELYNLRQDPKESQDVASQNPEVVSELHQMMLALRERPEREVYRPSPRDPAESEKDIE